MSVIDPDFLVELDAPSGNPSKSGLKQSFLNVDDALTTGVSLFTTHDLSTGGLTISDEENVRVHFIGTGTSDAIVVLSDGDFAGQIRELVMGGTFSEQEYSLEVRDGAAATLIDSLSADQIARFVWSAAGAWELFLYALKTAPGNLYGLSRVDVEQVVLTGTPAIGKVLGFDEDGFAVLDGVGVNSVPHTNPSLDDGDTITAELHGILWPSGTALQNRYNEARNASNVNNGVDLTLETDCVSPINIGVAADQVGTVTVDEGANTILGATAGVITLGPAGSSIWIIPLGSGVYKVEGEYVTSTTLLGDLDATDHTINVGRVTVTEQDVAGAYTVDGDDLGKLLRYTGAGHTFTINITSNSETGEVAIENDGTGAITVSAGTATLKGGTSVAVDKSATVRYFNGGAEAKVLVES